jgi:hypothetical protein
MYNRIMKRTEQEIMRDAETVARRDFPHAFCSPWNLMGLGSTELDALLNEAVVSRKPVDRVACAKLDREMSEYRKEGR